MLVLMFDSSCCNWPGPWPIMCLYPLHPLYILCTPVPDDEGSVFLWNTTVLLPDHWASHPRRQQLQEEKIHLHSRLPASDIVNM